MIVLARFMQNLQMSYIFHNRLISNHTWFFFRVFVIIIIIIIVIVIIIILVKLVMVIIILLVCHVFIVWPDINGLIRVLFCRAVVWTQQR